MKKFSLSLLALIIPIFFAGCNENQFEDKSLKEVLTNHTWYEIDQTQDRYVKHEFSGTEYLQTFYNTEKFQTVTNMVKGDIEKYDKERIKVNIDGSTYTCNLCGDEDIGYQIIDCNAMNGLLVECATLWKSRALSFQNSAVKRTEDY